MSADLVAALKRHLDITSEDEDLLLGDFVSAAVAQFERSTSRKVTGPADADPLVTIRRPVVGGVVQMPDAREVVSITGTAPGSVPLEPTSYRLQGWNYDETSVWAILDCDVLAEFPTHVEVVGRFGISPLPEDLRAAILILAAHRYRMRGAEGQGQWEDGGATMTFQRLPPSYNHTVGSWKVPKAPITSIALGGI